MPQAASVDGMQTRQVFSTTSIFTKNMARSIDFVLRFLPICSCFPFTYANLYDLNGNRTDACFQPSQKATAECLQELIEGYYGKYFTTYCTEFPLILAELRCTGCPWDRLDPKKINPDIAAEYWAASNESELFHEPDASCSLSKYVSGFGTFHEVANYATRWITAASIPILFSTGAIVQYTSGSTRLSRPSFFGSEVHEYMFMGAVWISYNTGVIILAISQDYYGYCDSTASNLAIAVADNLSYVVLIYYSLRRCRQLRFPQTDNNVGSRLDMQMAAQGTIQSLSPGNRAQWCIDSSKSWCTFVSDKEGMTWSEYIRSKRAIGFCAVYGSSAGVLFICIAEIFGLHLIKYYNEDGFTCSLSSVNMLVRAIAMAKLTLEPLAHIVYSFGASARSKLAYCIRYVVLALVASICITILFHMCSQSLHRPNSYGYLFPGVPLGSVVSETAEISHVLAVSIFGLLEPLRYGSIYPRQRNMSVSP